MAVSTLLFRTISCSAVLPATQKESQDSLRNLPVKSRVRSRLAVFFLLACFGFWPGHPVFAQGLADLVVTPTRVVFEGRTRSVAITLLNAGVEAATYRISIINMRMTETGQFKRLEKDTPAAAGEKFAEDLFHYAPRQVELAAGQSQVIRVLLQKPPGLESGEYRSHMLVRRIPRKGAGRSVVVQTGSDGIFVNLVVIPSVALPIIIRHGELSATASLSDMHLVRSDKSGDSQVVAFRINRTGNRSVFGDLTATYFPPGEKNGVVVSLVNMLAVYSPNATRSVAMGLTVPDGVTLQSGGRIAVIFRTPTNASENLIAEGGFTLP